MPFKIKPCILVIHGPNLNLLGEREPGIYGTVTLRQINRLLIHEARTLGLRTRCYQSNHEGRLIDRIHKARHRCRGLLINPGAFTHTSIALRDAIAATELPAVEVHLSNINQREPFRSHSCLADVCLTQISGLGAQSYIQGLHLLADHLTR